MHPIYKTATIHNGVLKDQPLNETYRKKAEHYRTAIIPAHAKSPKDKPKAEEITGNISTRITRALRDEQFFTLTG